MSAPPINSAQPMYRAGTHAQPPEQRGLSEAAISRFHQALNVPPGSGGRDFRAASAALRQPPNDKDASPFYGQADAAAPPGSLHPALAFSEPTAAEAPIAPQSSDMTRLIEQATSVMVERTARADEARFIVSLDHAIVGGASAEFIRDGAFLHIRLRARNETAYRSMYTHRQQLEERLAASTGLIARIEILEGHSNGSPR